MLLPNGVAAFLVKPKGHGGSPQEMLMDDQPTCGKGLAEHSALPAKLGDLTDATARVLELHMQALDIADPHTRTERDAYQELATAHRQLATELHATARRMAGYRDLPMGRHDLEVISAPENVDAFRSFVTNEEALLALLHTRLDKDRAMLVEMDASINAS